MSMMTRPDTRTPPSNRDPTHSMYTDANTSILLQTARAIVYNPNQPHLTTEVRLILDSGSQRSYVTYKLKHTLALEPLYIENMLIKTFGATDERQQMCPVLNLGVIIRCESNLELHLLAVPTICEPLSQPLTIYTMQNFDRVSRFFM